jgi:NAD(P)-dependent dehydrogenase (short-subunit alcohol dehydrogenase family)
VIAGVRQKENGLALQKQASSRLKVVQLDLTDQSQVEECAHQVRELVGEKGLAGLVNNAGVAVAAPLEFIPLDELRHQLEVNLVGHVALTQALMPCLRQARGRIINISSIGGRLAGGMIGAYHASKFALEAVCDTLRVELKPWGIEVISIEPGAIATPIWETSQARADKLLERMPSQVSELYAGPIARTRASAVNAAREGLAPERVAEVIERALTAARPRTRYLVGRDAWFAGNIIAHLPDRLRDRLLAAR